MSENPERFLWMRSLMDIQPNDQLLEIGCGAGLLAEELAKDLTTGHLTALDKSVAMVRQAKKRNHQPISRGVVKIEQADFLKFEPGEALYDKIVAFNVNFFWKDKGKEFPHLHQLLRPKGLLYVCYQAPYEITRKAADPIRETLEANSFTIVKVELKKLSPASAFCVTAKRE